MSEANKRPHQSRNPLSIPETAPIRQLFPDFNPFYVPQDAPIRKIVPPAGSQAQNPLGDNFHPFAVDKNAPISKLIRGGRPAASGTKITIDGKTYDTGYHSKEIAELRKKNPGGGNAAQSTSEYTPPGGGGGGGGGLDRGTSTRTNSAGVEQTGRNLGFITNLDDQGDGNPFLQGADGLYDRLGLGENVKINQNWSSNQLPGTASSPYQGGPVSKQLGEGEQNVVLAQDLQAEGGAVRDLESMPLEAFQESQGMKVDGIDSTERQSGKRNWMKPRELSAKEARRAAFLDAPNSMAGMRAVDAQLGRVRAGGDYHYVNPNAGQDGEPNFIKVSTETGRQHANGQITGQQLLNKYLDSVKTEKSVSTDNNVNPADFPADSEFGPDVTREDFNYFQNGGSVEPQSALNNYTAADFPEDSFGVDAEELGGSWIR